jgi:hypothetical protein
MPTESKPATKSKDPQEEPEAYTDVKTILSWHAPGRPFKVHSREYFTNILLIMLAIEIILFLFSQYLLMVVVLSLTFLTIALAIVPPHPFYYKITSEGIRIEDSFFLWNELYDFYFATHYGIQIIRIRTKAYFPGELTMTLGDVSEEQIKAAMIPYLPFREYVEPSFIEKAGHWLETNFPLEKTAK